jgi:hypothetical protein
MKICEKFVFKGHCTFRCCYPKILFMQWTNKVAVLTGASAGQGHERGSREVSKSLDEVQPMGRG